MEPQPSGVCTAGQLGRHGSSEAPPSAGSLGGVSMLTPQTDMRSLRRNPWSLLHCPGHHQAPEIRPEE